MLSFVFLIMMEFCVVGFVFFFSRARLLSSLFSSYQKGTQFQFIPTRE